MRRHTPFFNGYRPQFYFRTTDVTGAATLPSGTEMVMPGDNVSMTVELIAPVAMEQGLKFAIREGGRTVGVGVVSKLLNNIFDNMDISGLFIFPLFWFLKYRPVAQLVEHRSPKPEVGVQVPPGLPE